MRSTITISFSVFALALLMFSSASFAQVPAAPQEAIDYSTLAFYPQRWIEQDISTQMYPWEGKAVVLLTPTNEWEPEVMVVFIEHLDRGYAYYRKVIGTSPRPHKLVRNKPLIAAVPTNKLTCGFACGMVGATGIEVGNFPNDYRAVKANSKAMPHYYFYEMGRNYYVFGKRHNAFVTGFAVFMRYCCIEALELVDNDTGTRKAIDEAIDTYKKSDLGFVKAFTSAGGLSEKQPRFQNYRGPCDQPVMYASAMLKLKQEYGGEEFTQRFYHTLRGMPELGEGNKNPQDAYRQCVTWLVAASYAAQQDLSSVFCDQWRLPMSKEARQLMERTKWKSKQFDPVNLAQQILQN